MTRRVWLRHPAATPPPRPECPDGTRYPSEAIALTALLREPYSSHLQPTPCTHGHTGWHLAEPEPDPERADCEPNWRDDPDELDRLYEIGARAFHGRTAIYDRNITTVTAPEEYL